MLRPLSLILFAFANLTVIGEGAVCSFENLRVEHPEVMVHGNVVERDGRYYVLGTAERCFSGEDAESDEELDEEAVLDAKQVMLAWFQRTHPKCTLELSQVQICYRHTKDSVRQIVISVPVGLCRIVDKVEKLGAGGSPLET